MKTTVILLLVLLFPFTVFATSPREIALPELGPSSEGPTWLGLFTATLNGRFLTVWQSGVSPYSYIFGRVTDANGVPTGDRAHLVIPVAARPLALLAKQSAYVVFWEDGDSAPGRHHMTEVSLDGLPLSTIDLPSRIGSIKSVAWMAGRYLVVADTVFLIDERGRIVRNLSELGNTSGYEVETAVVQDHFVVVRMFGANPGIFSLSVDGDLIAGRSSDQPITRRGKNVRSGHGWHERHDRRG